MSVLTAVFPSKFTRGPIFREQKSLFLGLSDEQQQNNPEAHLEQAFFVQCSISEQYSLKSEISDNPVESGVDVTDNIYPKPVEITLDMVQSDTPIRFEDLITGLATGIGAQAGALASGAGPITAVAGAATGSLVGLLRNPSADTRGLAKTCFDHFELLWKRKAIMTVQTGLKLYENMAIQSISVNRTPKDGKSLHFSVSLREIQVVQSQVKEIKQIKDKNTNNKAQAKSDLGQQNTKETNASILKQLVNKAAKYYSASGA